MIEETKLDSLKLIIDEQQKEIAAKEYMVFKPIVDIVKDFIVKNELVLYGGMALNERVPKKHKFYADQVLPDYDCFAPQAKSFASKLAKRLSKEGFQHSQVIQGKHPKTFRVEVMGKIVCDVTQVSKRFYEYLMNAASNQVSKHQSDEKMLVAPIEFLKWSLHKELSSPQHSLNRWEKLYERYLVFHLHNEYKNALVPSYWEQDYIETENKKERYIASQFYEFAKRKQYPVIGTFALSILMGRKEPCCRKYYGFPYFDILTKDINATIAELESFVMLYHDCKLNVIKRRNYLPDIMPNRVKVTLKIKGIKDEIYMCGIFQTDSCYSVVKKHGFLVGTFDTILRFKYGFYILALVYKDFPNSHPEKIKDNIISLEKYLKTRPNARERFATQCYGTTTSATY